MRLQSSAIHGRGLFAQRCIRRGEVIGEYEGERVVKAVEDQRELQYAREGVDCYFCAIDGDSTGTRSDARSRSGKSVVIDRGVRRNLTRFINRSCFSNCATQEMLHGALAVLAILATKDVPRGHEITHNYCMVSENGTSKLCNCRSRSYHGFLY